MTTFHCPDYGFSTSVSHRYGFESTKLARGFPRTCPVLTTKVSLLLGLLHGRRRFASRAFDYAAERYCDLRAC